MAEKVQLQIEIGPDGKVRIKTLGFKGASCLAETEGLEKVLGKVVTREKTQEAYETDTSRTITKGGNKRR
jgi:hypothetical protein